MARRGRRKRVSPASMTLTEIRKLYEQAAMKERERLPELKGRQSELSSELASVTEEIEAIEGVVPAAAPRRRGRPKGTVKARGRRGRPPMAEAAAEVAKAATVKAISAAKGAVKVVKAAARAAKAAAVAKRPPGRPRKAVAVAKRRPGRPRKVVAAVAPAAARPRRGRPRKEGGEMTLRQAIAKVLSESDTSLAPSAIRDIILRKKLIANITPSFHQQVTGTLSRNPEFKRIEKGKYSL